MLENGEGVKKDPARARVLREKACSAGETSACQGK
jgi:TPR repeat protein